MFNRKIILFFFSLAIITCFFLLPRNTQWGRTVVSYWTDFQHQKNLMDKETRMRHRLGSFYTYSRNIADSVRKKCGENELVLLPPTTYFTKLGIGYRVPEPSVFYYFTGVKTIWANSSQAIQADKYVRVQNGRIVIEEVTDRNALRDTIAAFQKLGVSL